MALQDTDFFLVNRNTESYKMAASALADYVGGGGASVHVGENPPTGTPEQGDLWWKSDVGILYVYYVDENTSQWVQAAGSAGGGGEGSSSVTVGDTPPTGASQGDLWWNTDDGRLYVYYTDNDSTQWVDASPAGGGGSGDGASVTVSDTPPSTPTQGDLWWDSSDGGGRLYVWYNDGNTQQWVETSPSGGGDGGGIEEAPNDGQQYARQNSDWTVVESGDVIYQGAAAWASVADDGTIENGLNVATVTRVAQGSYDVEFTNSMPNDDYAVTIAGATNNIAVPPAVKNADGFRYNVTDNSFNLVDAKVSFAVHALNALPPQGGTGTDAWGTVNANGTMASSFNLNVQRTYLQPTGSYAFAFVNNMPNGNYSVQATPQQQSGVFTTVRNTKSAGGFIVDCLDVNNPATFVDCDISVTVNATNARLPLTITEDQIAALIQNPTLSAWGSVNADGTVNGLFNIKPGPISRPATGTFDLEFVTPMPNDDYSVTISSTSVNSLVRNKTTTGFSVLTFESDYSSSWFDFDFQVAGTARNGTLGGGADAWGDVDGTNATLRGGLNCTISSPETGVYDISFVTPLPNDNYAITFGGSGNVNLLWTNKTTSGFRVNSWNNDFNGFIIANFDFAVFATDGNAGGFWVKTGDELAPINDDIDVNIGGQVTIGTPSDDEGVLLGDEGFISLRKDGALYSSFNIYNGSFDNAGRKVSINNDGSGTFAGRVTSDSGFTAGGNPNGGTETGVRFDSAGGIKASRPTAANVFEGYTTGNSTPTVEINANGQIEVKAAIANGINPSGGNAYKFYTSMGTSLPWTGGALYLNCYTTNSSPSVSDPLALSINTNGVNRYKITPFGQVNARSLVFQTEPDNPANFNVEGEYTGPTLDVKDRIQNLLSRLDAIEANEVIDDATDSSLLQLVASASARLDAIEATNASLEARITALEGGN